MPLAGLEGIWVIIELLQQAPPVEQRAHKINNKLMSYYRSTHYRPPSPYATKTSSHLLGLDNILAKYQIENQALTQQVSKLISENRQLQASSLASGNRDDQILSLRDKWANSLSASSPSNKKTATKEHQYQPKHEACQISSSRYRQKSGYRYKNGESDGDRTVRKKGGSRFVKQDEEKQNVPKLSCQVYMEEDTFDIEQAYKPVQNNLQSFEEPSFGNNQLMEIHVKQPLAPHGNKGRSRTEMSEESDPYIKGSPEPDKMEFSKIKSETVDEKKANSELMKKNNAPYIGYKLGEPKTELRKLNFSIRGDRGGGGDRGEGGDKGNQCGGIKTNSSLPKKSYLSLLSRSIFHQRR